MRLDILILSILISSIILLRLVLKNKSQSESEVNLHFPSFYSNTFTPEAVEAACNQCISSDSIYARIYLLIQRGILKLEKTENGYRLKENKESYKEEEFPNRGIIETIFDKTSSVNTISQEAKKRLGLYVRSSAYSYSKKWFNPLSATTRSLIVFAMILPLFTYFALLFTTHKMTILSFVFYLLCFVVLSCFFAVSPDLPISSIFDNRQENISKRIAMIKHIVPIVLYVTAMFIFKNILVFVVLIACYTMDSWLVQHIYDYTDEGKKWNHMAQTFKQQFADCTFDDEYTELIAAYLTGNMSIYEEKDKEKADAFCDFLSWCEGNRQLPTR